MVHFWAITVCVIMKFFGLFLNARSQGRNRLNKNRLFMSSQASLEVATLLHIQGRERFTLFGQLGLTAFQS